VVVGGLSIGVGARCVADGGVGVFVSVVLELYQGITGGCGVLSGWCRCL